MKSFQEENFKFYKMTQGLLNRSLIFSCGDSDLDDFFANEALLYDERLMGKTYCYVKELDFEQQGKDLEIVAAFTVANDSLRIYDLPNSRRKKMLKQTDGKHLKRYPGVLLGRLGVNQNYQHNHYGSEILKEIKRWFCDAENKTGCRFVIVDALNCDRVINFYENNGCLHLFSSEEQEAFYEDNSNNKKLATRLMYFDLFDLSSPDKNL